MGAKQTIDLKYNTFYFAGKNDSSIILGNYTAPGYLLVVSNNLKDSQAIQVPLHTERHHLPYPVKAIASSNYFIFYSLLSNKIVKTNATTLATELKQLSTSTGIDGITLMDDENILIKTYDTLKEQRILSIASLTDKEIVYKYWPEPISEGVYSTNGTFLVDRDNNRIFYILDYRSQITVLNTKLEPLTAIKTIEGTANSQIYFTIDSSMERKSIWASERGIHANAIIADEYLLVHSSLTAKNEPITIGKSYWIIDAYNSGNGNYTFSFYVPFENGEKPIDFIYSSGSLYVLYGNCITKYDVSFPN